MDSGGDLSLIKNAWAQAAFAGLLFAVLGISWWMERKERIKLQEAMTAQSAAFDKAKDDLHEKHISLLRDTIESDNKVAGVLERLVDQQRTNATAIETFRAALLTRGSNAG